MWVFMINLFKKELLINKTTIKYKSISLKELTEEDIEIVRNWRNSERVRLRMHNQEYITKEKQIKWYSQIKLDNNYYYIIKNKKKSIGFVSLKYIDDITGEPGIYIGDKEYDGLGFGFAAAFLISYFALNYIHIDKLRITIKKNNKQAIRLNKSLGYNLFDCNLNSYNTYELSVDDFNKKAASNLKLLKGIL